MTGKSRRHYHCKALNSLLCADVPLRNYSLTHFTVFRGTFCFLCSSAVIISFIYHTVSRYFMARYFNIVHALMVMLSTVISTNVSTLKWSHKVTLWLFILVLLESCAVCIGGLHTKTVHDLFDSWILITFRIEICKYAIFCTFCLEIGI